jgi:hypothetical protein
MQCGKPKSETPYDGGLITRTRKEIRAMAEHDPTKRAPSTRGRAPARATDKINWYRFWVQMAIAALAFNVLAGLLTWYFIFPKLFPPH